MLCSSPCTPLLLTPTQVFFLSDPWGREGKVQHNKKWETEGGRRASELNPSWRKTGSTTIQHNTRIEALLPAGSPVGLSAARTHTLTHTRKYSGLLCWPQVWCTHLHAHVNYPSSYLAADTLQTSPVSPGHSGSTVPLQITSSSSSTTTSPPPSHAFSSLYARYGDASRHVLSCPVPSSKHVSSILVLTSSHLMNLPPLCSSGWTDTGLSCNAWTPGLAPAMARDSQPGCQLLKPGYDKLDSSERHQNAFPCSTSTPELPLLFRGESQLKGGVCSPSRTAASKVSEVPRRL